MDQRRDRQTASDDHPESGRFGPAERGPVVVTGATGGIGEATALMLASRGWTVYATGRDPEKVASIESRLRALDPRERRHRGFTADLSSLEAVAGLASALASAAREDESLSRGESAVHGRIGALVCNAGTYSSWYQATLDGFELQLAVNHLAHFYLANALADNLRASPDGRVVALSSGSHHGPGFPFSDPNLLSRYGELRSYQRSKLANLLFIRELQARLGPGESVSAHAADPGLAKTDMGFKGASSLARAFWRFQLLRASPPARSALNTVFLVESDDARAAPGLYWKDCKPIRPSAAASDSAAARALWELSERMCGLDARVRGFAG